MGCDSRLAALLSIALLLIPVSAHATSDVSGTWDLEMRLPGVTSTGTCTFGQDDQALTGTCGGTSDRFRVIEGRVTGTLVSWQLQVTQDGFAGLMKFAGELDADGSTVRGSFGIDGGQDGTFVMTKQR